ncbi:PTS fructose transporter subunit IIB [Vibrio sonorensis]|uniref:PTS fructose transporter subunit IIB n=1 Tax=Vibrio sonorensis TaxID=1004316 RepID=UPI0008D98471|nr:PTS fructose transporter subunit IIB [Vibrio sonorensis]
MKIIAVTACPTGIAHTYMAADALRKEAQRQGINIKIETQGAMGIENALSASDIAGCDLVLIVSDIDIEQSERFVHCKRLFATIEETLTNVSSVIQRCLNA